jgi:RHS repeat-associated protein
MLDDSGKEVLEKTISFLYDGNGNELRRQTGYVRPHDRDMKQTTGANPNGDGLTNELYTLFEKTSNTFDGFNRLKRAEQIQGGVRSSIEYMYDGDGLRTQTVTRSSKDNSVRETNYVYDRQYVVLETNELDAVSVRYVRGVNYIARIDAAAKLSYFLFNGHGDVVHTVSETGVVENTYDYDIFGSPILTVEMYASSIRYAGEFYDAEVGLYYLRARYYDPYIGRFVSEDTYRGQANDPLSLNLYAYVLNNPLIYWDPTGHWVQSDKDLNKEAQAKIIALTSAYYKAQSTQEKKAIQAQAEAIRDDDASRKKVVTPLVFQSKEIEKAVDEGVSKRGYMTAKEWEKTVEEAGFTTKTVPTGSMWSGTSTTTTTTIGRTNLEVNSSYKYSTNTQTSVTTETSTASIKLSYNITAKETPFIKSVASKDVTLEQVLVIYDTLEANDGKITKKQLEEIGIKVNRGFGGTIDSLEAVYGITTQTGSTLAEASIQYQEEIASKNLMGVFGSRVTKISPGAFSVSSNRTSKSVTVKTTSCNCFTAGTKVLTDEGEKNIEDIKVGDKVLSKDEVTGEQAYKEVTHLYRNDKEIIYELTVGDQVIETTDNHPFWVEGKGWVLAADLQVGDELQQSNGNTLTIDNIKIVKHDEKVKVYNFTVADFHTYFVSDLGIWVHNINCLDSNYYLTEALKKQNLSSAPKNFKQTWSQDGYDFEVRIHEANPQYGKSGSIYRVARRQQGKDANGQGYGWEYIDQNGQWHHTSTLKPSSPNYNSQAAADTHIQLP